ncbi:MAG: chromosome segregation protein SMC [Actinomycetia bacterium]|nr:chromosome segregation protein SMC [Actinomycetes bacterium]
MFLKNLSIKGFKSFADAASLELEPGVTVVVGPNGSGKSNVVDAIGWVLGAQAPSAVRSQKMDDVIFAGTEKRPALGRAEVSLTIDNSAGLLPIEFTEVTITRLLFRSGDSEYSINGTPCRLLDIQELLSDSGVGRQQHVIVSQGNIDGVLNARPEDRRLIIEEAAGVLKFRRRKERAERRLASTEANLTRIQDLLREVRRQLRPLERQADAARRHGDLVAELSALRLHLAGRELARLKAQLANSAASQKELASMGESLKARLADLDARVATAEAELSALGATDLGDTLVRLETVRERGRGQVALLAERRRSIQRELDAAVDEAVVASLEAERAQLRSESEQINSEAAELTAGETDLTAAESGLAQQWELFEEQWGDGVDAPTGEAAAMRSELAALRTARERSGTDRDQLTRRRAALAERLDRLTDERDAALGATKQAREAAPRLIESARRASDGLLSAEAAEEQATTAARDTEAAHSAWTARVEALALALDDARQGAGAQRLSGLDGVLGTLRDLVEVDAGWEEAFEAAAGEALAAVVVADLESARRALSSLASGDHSGAVLALGMAAGSKHTPPGGEPVRDHVRCAPGVERSADVSNLLDRLLNGAAAVHGGWQDAAQLAAQWPDAVVVTTDGHRFGSGGWRLGAAGSGATGAALEEAQQAAEQSHGDMAMAAEAAGLATESLASARAVLAEAERARDTNESAMSRSSEAADRLALDASEVAQEVSDLDDLVEQIAARLAGEVERITTLEAELPRLEAEEAELSRAAAEMAETREKLEQRTAQVRSQRTDSDVRSAALSERSRYVADRLEHLDERLEGLASDAEEAAAKRVLLEARAAATERLGEFVTVRMRAIESDLEARREERRRQSEAARAATERLESLRSERTDAEAQLAETTAKLQKAEIGDAEVRTRLEAATEMIRNELDAEPDAALAAECPLLEEGVTPAGRARDLQRELKAMGPINPLALQEFEELSERHTFLDGQLHDVRQTRRELGKVIKAVDEEIVNVFAAAFADVSENFTHLFETLFPGGAGKLRLTDPNNLLDTGIEIEARPSGKNVKKLSLLSGGERSLTALAYLFAVFRSRPSPFYVMDEVEAALDDVNLHRFLDLVTEFRSSAQLVIVSHQKRTMEAADVLYGVSMEQGGSSKVVAERASEVVDVR